MNALYRCKTGVITISLLAAALVWAPVANAAPASKPTVATNKSDLNRDGIVDYDDLTIFSSRFLEQNVETMDWCAFVAATGLDDELYGRPPSYYVKHYTDLLSFIKNSLGCDHSDLNNDGRVNRADLVIFSFHFLGLNWDTVDWCAFYTATAGGQRFNSKPTAYYEEKFSILIGFIKDYFGCISGPLLLKVENSPKALVRMATTTDDFGNVLYFFTDPRVGSVFIYDANLMLIGELKNLQKPLGLAIDTQGYLLVGSDVRNNIEVYDPDDGVFLSSFGDGLVKMPSAITIGPDGKIYVTDSRNHNIHVFDPAYVSLGTIGSQGQGEAELDFPTNSLVVEPLFNGTSEYALYVADQGNRRIQVYDLQGGFLRTINPPGRDRGCGWFNPNCGRTEFIRLQALGVDSLGRLHALDVFEAKVTILNAVTGQKLGSYGTYGLGPGLLKAPVDLLLIAGNKALVTDASSDDIEVFTIP